MRFYFIRHAQSIENQLYLEKSQSGDKTSDAKQSRIYSKSDPELSDIGRRQTQTLSSFLLNRKEQGLNNADTYPFNDNFDFTHIYASLMIRTIDTASAIADALNLKLVIREDLYETGGFWEIDSETDKPKGGIGKNRNFFEQRYPDCVLPDCLGEEGWWNRPLETSVECEERAHKFFQFLMEKHGNTRDRVAIVSHGLFCMYLMKVILKIPQEHEVLFILNNAAITRFDFTKDRNLLIYQNRYDFFPSELVT